MKFYTLLSVSLLCVIALTSITLRGPVQRNPLTEADSLYKLKYKIETLAEKSGATISIAYPTNTNHIRILGQYLEHPEFRFVPLKSSIESNDLIFVNTSPGEGTIILEFDIQLSKTTDSSRKNKKVKLLKKEKKQQYLKNYAYLDNQQIINVAANFKQINASHSESANAIYNFSITNGKKLNSQVTAIDNQTLVVDLMIYLLRKNEIPARKIVGFLLEETSNNAPHYWVEAYVDQKWIFFDPLLNKKSKMPFNYLPLSKHSDYVYKTTKTITASHVYLIERQNSNLIVGSTKNSSVFDIFNLNRLSFLAQSALGILLLLPFGALITTFAVCILGTRPFGTFGPTLLGLSFTVLETTSSILIFTVVGLIGLIGRSMIPAIGLTKTPRLSIVFTLVALSLGLGFSINEFFGIGTSELVVLLPIVVLSSLIDRFYTVADEKGLASAILRLFWTIIISLAIMPIFQQETWGQWVLKYPEIHAFTVAAIILLSQYKGVKLFSLKYLNILQEKKNLV